MPLRFNPEVLEVDFAGFDSDLQVSDGSRLETRKVCLKTRDEEVNPFDFFVGQQVVLDPPRNIRFHGLWKQIANDYEQYYPARRRGTKIINAFIVGLPPIETAELDASSRHYNVVLDFPSMTARERPPEVGDKVTLTMEAIVKFTGGVLKSRGNPEGSPPTFRVGEVVKCCADSVKVCLLDSDESSWYDTKDLYVIENWKCKLKENVPEVWLRHHLHHFSSRIEQLTLEELLLACPVHHIPVFQRRYCWTQTQWQALWADLVGMRNADPAIPNHSLGRILMKERKDGSRLVLDGQQRFTTLSLLLCAIRDRLQQIGATREACSLEVLVGTNRLIPTLDDRSDFRRCINEERPDGERPLLQAKRFYADLCSTLGAKECEELVLTARRRFSSTAFILLKDERLQVIFHLMSEGWGVEGPTPGVKMSGVDFIRNFILESFENEQTMKAIHAEYWSPLETQIGSPQDMEHFFQNFLTSKGIESVDVADLYDDFELWWKMGMPAEVSDLSSYALAKLRDIVRFAKPQLSNAALN